MRVTITYDTIAAKASRRGPCTVCGKKVTRSTTFTETNSPFNRIGEGADRRPKTDVEIQQSVDRKAQEWDPPANYFDHYACREN